MLAFRNWLPLPRPLFLSHVQDRAGALLEREQREGKEGT